MGQMPHVPANSMAASSFAVTRRGEGRLMSGKDGMTAGERFARALAAKDSAALCALLADPVDFQALTPGRHWQAGTGRQAVEEIILARWFGSGDEITALCSVTPGRVLDREHVAYRVRVRRE